MGKTLYVATLEKSDIESLNIKPILQTISSLESLGESAFKSLAIAISGYDDTSIELWETPEVRRWAHKLINKIPYLFYYIETDAQNTQQTLMLCMNDFELLSLVQRKSPEQYHEEGYSLEDMPQHQLKIHVHQKSFRLMLAELRKYARRKGKPKLAEQLIKEMSDTYGVSTD
jgi:hypothetical protein